MVHTAFTQSSVTGADMLVCEGGRFNCTSDVCDVDCEWSGWSVWTPCSVSCGTGHQTSSRHILKSSQYRGAPCEGPKKRTRTCTAPDCGMSSHSTFIVHLMTENTF
ncbi:hypothetical protein WMY93_030270 [Mugilogobius chulae]|uniref:Spondin-like TSP1 domain-containing protein n=1 Tax=Mugilogobius chulae TaxID=88201 RepID=A0AAW0MTH8_9GOBI